MHGQLPFDVKGMDDGVPTIDFSPDRIADPPYSLERMDVDGIVLPSSLPAFCLVDSYVVVHTGLIGVLGDLEHFAQSTGDAAAMSSVKEARASLERLIGKMDGIESGFDRIAERSRKSGDSVSSI